MKLSTSIVRKRKGKSNKESNEGDEGKRQRVSLSESVIASWYRLWV